MKRFAKLAVTAVVAAVTAVAALSAPASATFYKANPLYWYPGQDATFSTSEYSALGTRPTYVVDYACIPSSSWQNPLPPWLASAHNASVNVFLKIHDGSDCAGNLANTASGADNSYLKAWGTDIAKAGIPLEITYDWEQNGSWNGYDPATWVKAWNNVTTQVNSTDKDLVKWVWNPNSGPQSVTDKYWTGVKNVGAIAIDSYLCWGNEDLWPNGQCKQQYNNTIKANMDADHALAPSLPYFIGETAIGGTNRNMELNALVGQSQIDGVQGVTYFNQAIGSQKPLTASEQAALGASIRYHW